MTQVDGSRDQTPGKQYGKKVNVERKKGVVYIKSYGSAPFAVVRGRRGIVVIPDGYDVLSFCDHYWWKGETKVKDGIAGYKFTLYDNPLITSDWEETPTAAYKKARMMIDGDDSKTNNGQLIIGVGYPNIQALIRKKFPEVTSLLHSGHVPPKKRFKWRLFQEEERKQKEYENEIYDLLLSF